MPALGLGVLALLESGNIANLRSCYCGLLPELFRSSGEFSLVESCTCALNAFFLQSSAGNPRSLSVVFPPSPHSLLSSRIRTFVCQFFASLVFLDLCQHARLTPSIFMWCNLSLVFAAPASLSWRAGSRHRRAGSRRRRAGSRRSLFSGPVHKLTDGVVWPARRVPAPQSPSPESCARNLAILVQLP